MKEPYGKGLATYTDPESCAGGGNTAGEAPAATHTRRPGRLSRRVAQCGRYEMNASFL